MADSNRRLATNVDGDLFVDETCIDCDTCRWMAPETFDRRGAHSRVHHQPASDPERRSALMALVSCPTASIGTSERAADLPAALAALPARVEDEVFHTGFHHESSFGAAAYFVQRPGGNVLIDSPRFAGPLVRRLEELGGVDWMLLTHKDDVADHARFAEHFGARRVLHRDDVTPGTADVEVQIEGADPVALDDELRVIPVPGHTRGSVCFLYRERFLFTGDHLAWSATLGQLYAFRSACWYDWDVQRASMGRLLDVPFTWVLPGHGRRARVEDSRAALELCLDWMD